MKVYKVRIDPDVRRVNCRRGDPKRLAIAERGVRRSDTWTPIRVLSEDPDEPSDLPYFISDVLVMTDHAIDVLGDVFAPWGEFLPLKHRGDRLTMFVPLVVLDALDRAASDLWTLPTGRVVSVNVPVFRPEVIGQTPIFRLPPGLPGDMNLTEEVADAIRRSGLRGVDLHLIWSDE